MSDYAEFSFASQPLIYFEAELKFSVGFYDEADPVTAEIVRFRDGGSNSEVLRLRSGTPRWDPLFSYPAVVGHTEADTWHTVVLGLASDGVFVVDGDDSGGIGSDTTVDAVRIGTNGSGGQVWMRNVKVGTTLGGSDLVNAPTERVRPPDAAEYVRVYGFQIRLGDDGVETVDRLITSPDGF